MPTYLRLPRVDRDVETLTSEDRARFRVAVQAFVVEPAEGRGSRPGLRVERVQAT